MFVAMCPSPRTLTCAFAVAMALSGSLGCRQIFGTNEFYATSKVEDAGFHPTNQDESVDASNMVSNQCTLCMQEHCQPQFKACLNEPTCNDFWNCRIACTAGDGYCQNKCRSRAWPWNGGAYRVDQTGELEACVANACDAVCKQTHVVGTSDCMDCVSGQCDDVDLKAYTADVDVQHLESCDARCVAITVSDDRRLAYCDCPGKTGAASEAVTRWNARRTCTTLTCAGPCNGASAPDLDCLGTTTFVSAVPAPITYRLVAYGLPTVDEVESATASACTVTEPGCTSTHGGPYPLNLLRESHFVDAGGAVGAQDFAGSADFAMNFQTTYEPYADHMEVRVAGYRNLLYEVPLLAQDKLTVWWPVASRDELLAKLQIVQSDVAVVGGSIIVVIVADCEGRALPGAEIEAQLTAGSSGDAQLLQPRYVLGDGQTSTIGGGIAFFSGVPTGAVEVTATYRGQFHSKGRVLVVADGYTLIGLGPSAPPPGETH
jgi:hypothetical protein